MTEKTQYLAGICQVSRFLYHSTSPQGKVHNLSKGVSSDSRGYFHDCGRLLLDWEVRLAAPSIPLVPAGQGWSYKAAVPMGAMFQFKTRCLRWPPTCGTVVGHWARFGNDVRILGFAASKA